MFRGRVRGWGRDIARDSGVIDFGHSVEVHAVGPESVNWSVVRRRVRRCRNQKTPAGQFGHVDLQVGRLSEEMRCELAEEVERIICMGRVDGRVAEGCFLVKEVVRDGCCDERLAAYVLRVTAEVRADVTIVVL